MCYVAKTVLNMYVWNIYPTKFHVYNCLFWLGSQSRSESQYSKSSTNVLSYLRCSNALANTSNPISTASPKMGVFGTRLSYRPVALSPQKYDVLPKEMHCTSSVLWCLENKLNNQTPLSSKFGECHPTNIYQFLGVTLCEIVLLYTFIWPFKALKHMT